MAVYVSTNCLRDRSHSIIGVLDAYAGAGLKHVELGTTPESIPGLTMNALRQYDFQFLCHHLFPPPQEPFIINLASQDRGILERSREQLKKSIAFCNSFDIDFFSFHSGFRSDPDIHFNFSRDKAVSHYKIAFNTYIESVEEINNYAQNMGVKIAVENNVLSDYNVINGENPYLLTCRAEEFEELFAAVGSANVGVLLDLGHLKITSHWLGFDKFDFIDRVKDRVFAIHLHDNDELYDAHKMLDETSWCFEVIGSSAFTGLPVVLESANLSIEQIGQQVRLIERFHGSTVTGV